MDVFLRRNRLFGVFDDYVFGLYDVGDLSIINLYFGNINL